MLVSFLSISQNQWGRGIQLVLPWEQVYLHASVFMRSESLICPRPQGLHSMKNKYPFICKKSYFQQIILFKGKDMLQPPKFQNTYQKTQDLSELNGLSKNRRIEYSNGGVSVYFLFLCFGGFILLSIFDKISQLII